MRDARRSSSCAGLPASSAAGAESKGERMVRGIRQSGRRIFKGKCPSVDHVPLFGCLPIIGNLFRHTAVFTSSEELLFFLTPRILPNWD